MYSEADSPTRLRHMYTSLLKRDSTYTPRYKKSKLIGRSKKTILSSDQENIHVSSALFEKLKIAELICAVLALAGFGLASIIYDLTYQEKLYQDHKTEVDILFAFSSLITLFLLAAILWRTQRYLNWQISKVEFSQMDTICSSGMYKTLIIELLLNLIHPFYWSEIVRFKDSQNTLKFEVEYTLVGILSVLMIVRIYHFLRLISVYSSFRNSRSQRLCQINGSSAGTGYSVKCLVQENPYIVIIVTLLLGLGVFAYCFRVFERPISKESGQDFSIFGNSMWCVIITMTTVGYGDFFPITIYGRIIGFLACIYGVMVVSLAVVTLTNLLSMDLSEEKSLLLLNRLKFKESLRSSAGNLITSFAKYVMLSKNTKTTDKILRMQLRKYRKYLNDFNTMKSKMKLLYDSNSPEERMERKLLNIVERLDNIEEVYAELDTTLSHIEIDLNNS